MSNLTHSQACADARQRVGYTEERPRQVAYKALGCAGCNRPFGANHDDWCQVLDPGPDPVRPAGPIAPVPSVGEQQCQGPCEQILPASVEFFQRVPGGRIGNYCRVCHGERTRQGQARKKGQYGAEAS